MSTHDPELEALFNLPETVVQNQEIRTLYFVLAERFRSEAEQSGLGIRGYILAERLAFTYITLRQKEWGLSRGFVGNSQQVQMNKLYLEYTREFALSTKDAQGKQSTELMEKFKDVILKTVSEEKDPKARAAWAARFVSAFEEANLS